MRNKLIFLSLLSDDLMIESIILSMDLKFVRIKKLIIKRF